MTGQKLEWRTAGPAFAVGVVAGLLLKEGLRRAQELARRTWAHQEHEATIAYDDNLPDSLERREPAPHEGQPRYGGTGALGFSPAVAAEAKPSDT
jgi:hypothetical protein